MKRFVVTVLAAAVLVAGCGKSDEEKRAEEAAKAAELTARSAEQTAASAAKGMEAMAKGLESLAGGGSGGDVKPVDPVSFRDMQALFPDIDGWEKGKPIGERMSTPFAFSTAEVNYTKGDARIELKMTDSGLNQMLLMPYGMFLQAGYEKETSDGYEKSASVNGQPGWEKWNTESKSGEVNALVGKRFLVTIEGTGVDDAKALHDVANRIDMGKLASLK